MDKDLFNHGATNHIITVHDTDLIWQTSQIPDAIAGRPKHSQCGVVVILVDDVIAVHVVQTRSKCSREDDFYSLAAYKLGNHSPAPNCELLRAHYRAYSYDVSSSKVSSSEVSSSEVSSSDGHQLALAHYNTSLCPHNLASQQVSEFHGHPLVLAHCNTSKCPFWAALGLLFLLFWKLSSSSALPVLPIRWSMV